MTNDKKDIMKPFEGWPLSKLICLLSSLSSYPGNENTKRVALNHGMKGLLMGTALFLLKARILSGLEIILAPWYAPTAVPEHDRDREKHI